MEAPMCGLLLFLIQLPVVNFFWKSTQVLASCEEKRPFASLVFSENEVRVENQLFDQHQLIRLTIQLGQCLEEVLPVFRFIRMMKNHRWLENNCQIKGSHSINFCLIMQFE